MEIFEATFEVPISLFEYFSLEAALMIFLNSGVDVSSEAIGIAFASRLSGFDMGAEMDKLTFFNRGRALGF